MTMDIANVNGIELEYEIRGSGEPVLLISPVLADGFVPLMEQPSLADHFQLIHYHKRGWVSSTQTPGPVSVQQHTEDATALLEYLDIPCAHVAGHSSGAAVAAQLALGAPGQVQSVILLELSLFSLPHGREFLAGAGPVFDAYEAGDHQGALAMFLTAVSGLEWDACQEILEERVPGAIEQTLKDVHTFFGVELPGLVAWTLDADQAASIHRPVLSVLGTDTQPLWVEVAAFLRSTLPDVEETEIESVGHLLHIQRPAPVAHAIAQFLQRHPIARK
jgi:pimeloyl-ACP methyl ester carboxylesterase